MQDMIPMSALDMQYIDIRDRVMKLTFDSWSAYGLDEEQMKAVNALMGPVLVLAGAGSGKTAVLTHRLANLLVFGLASELTRAKPGFDDEMAGLAEDMLRRAERGDRGALRAAQLLVAYEQVDPSQVMAVTFTNKAAGEMRARVMSMLEGSGVSAHMAVISTIHSLCLKIVKTYGIYIGFSAELSVFDEKDSKKLLEKCVGVVEETGLPVPRDMKISEAMGAISSWKCEGISPEQARADCGDDDDPWDKFMVSLYEEYERQLMLCSAVDFDNILLYAHQILQTIPEALAYYRSVFRFFMIDEYQDTNKVQFDVITALARGSENLFVVGDDDQSIYRFRGARVELIRNFPRQYKRCRMVQLKYNYRSGSNIVQAAQNVISIGVGRFKKDIQAARFAKGEVLMHASTDEVYEGVDIAKFLKMKHERDGIAYGDMAVLYRTNRHSRCIEKALLTKGMPYRVVRGHGLMDSEVARDLTAYMKAIACPKDVIAAQRVACLHQGVGDGAVGKVLARMEEKGLLFLDAARELSEESKNKTSAALGAFVANVGAFRKSAEQSSLADALTGLIRSVYGEQAERRRKSAKKKQSEEECLEQQLEYAEMVRTLLGDRGGMDSVLEALDTFGLMTDERDILENGKEKFDGISLMTIHGAKGLEFKVVVIAGVEDGLMPLRRGDEDADLDEELRLFYVAMTRAKDSLLLSRAKTRSRFTTDRRGQTVKEIEGIEPSPFLALIPGNLIQITRF